MQVFVFSLQHIKKTINFFLGVLLTMSGEQPLSKAAKRRLKRERTYFHLFFLFHVLLLQF